MKVLRTLDTSFDSLPGYEFEPHYVEVPAGDSSTGHCGCTIWMRARVFRRRLCSPAE